MEKHPPHLMKDTNFRCVRMFLLIRAIMIELETADDKQAESYLPGV